MRRLALVIAICLAIPSLAHAEPTKHHWYGAKPALADGVALGLVGVFVMVHHDRDLTAAGILGVYAAGAPLLEAYSGHPYRGAASFAARVGVPLATYYAVEATNPKDYDDPGATGMVFAIGAGLVTAIVDDVTCIETVPYVAPVPDGAAAGVTGHF
jgi:hypothetical protein